MVIDRKTRNILSREIADETVLDETCCTPLIDSAQHSLQTGTLKIILGDGAYDHLTIFNDLDDRHISSLIKIRTNASRRSNGSSYRTEYAREFLDAGYTDWAKSHAYGARWAIEGVFSAMKRIFGESVKASSIEGMFHEMRLDLCL